MTEDIELTTYAAQLQRLLDRVCGSVEGLDEAQLNWRPPAAETNSVYALATHILGNAEAWVLGIVCEMSIERDRPAEFRASGTDPSAIVERARDLGRRFDDALAVLRPSQLEEVRDPPAQLWGAGNPTAVTVRQAFLHVIEHASDHLGQIAVTRDWLRAARG